MRYHVGKTGPGKCHASKRACPLGGESGTENHFDSMEAAAAAFQAQQEGEHGAFATVKKGPAQGAPGHGLPIALVETYSGQVPEVFQYLPLFQEENRLSGGHPERARQDRDASVAAQLLREDPSGEKAKRISSEMRGFEKKYRAAQADAARRYWAHNPHRSRSNFEKFGRTLTPELQAAFNQLSPETQALLNYQPGVRAPEFSGYIATLGPAVTKHLNQGGVPVAGTGLTFQQAQAAKAALKEGKAPQGLWTDQVSTSERDKLILASFAVEEDHQGRSFSQWKTMQETPEFHAVVKAAGDSPRSLKARTLLGGAGSLEEAKAMLQEPAFQETVAHYKATKANFSSNADREFQAYAFRYAVARLGLKRGCEMIRDFYVKDYPRKSKHGIGYFLAAVREA